MTDDELLEVLAHLLVEMDVVAELDDATARLIVEPGLVRVRTAGRGGASFLLGRDGGILRYSYPMASDELAAATFHEGRRSAVPEGALEAAGFRHG